MRCILFRPSGNGTSERPDATISQYTELEATVQALLPGR